MVTSSFVIVFQQTLPEAVATTLSWVVIGVSAVSAMMGFVLEALSYFDRDGGAERTAPADPTPTTSSRPWVPDGDVKPLPPLINFDDELEQLYDYFDGEFPSQAETFLEGYKRMKTADRGQRGTIASDVRAGLNPIIVLVDDPEVESMLSQMGEDLFAYVKTDGAELVSVDRYALYDDGKKAPVDELQGRQARIRASVSNDGESMKTDVLLRFTDGDGIEVKRTKLPVGEVPTAATKELNTQVYVPSVASSVTVSPVPAAASREVLDM
ncbi:hypothetical protein BRC88_05015 [Halobacteriales archaeon QS_4_69_225]|nr:MAG: hypothetical protein BRC88_05015 [Halobacteriales archaeon QS_4_69_225]